MTETGGRRYNNYHEVYNPYMRFDALKYLTGLNQTSSGKEKDVRFVAALLLTLSGENPSDPFRLHAVKVDFMADIFRVRVADDKQRMATFKQCLSYGLAEAIKSREKAQQQMESGV